MNITLIIVSILSGLLFGYDAGVFSNALTMIQQAFNIPAGKVGFLVAIVPFSALIFALIIGKISDELGRRKVLFLTGVTFILGSLQCALAESLLDLMVGRMVLGAAIGMSATLAPLYIVEVADRHHRGLLVTLYMMSINIGLFIAALMSGLFAYFDAWRNMLALGVVPAILLLGCVWVAPESPRWLGLQGEGEQGLASGILVALYGVDEAASTIESLRQIRQTPAPRSFFQLFKHIRVILIAILISIFSQAVGIQAIIYYTGVIFSKAGVDNHFITSIASLVVAVIFMVSAMLSARLIDFLKRRQLLLGGLIGIISSLVIISWAFHYVHQPDLLGLMVLMGCGLFVACQGMSLGPLSFLIPAEIIPARIRGLGMGIAIAANWATSTVVVYSFPLMLHRYGPDLSFSVFLLFALLALGWSYFVLPETQNMRLESIEQQLLDGEFLTS